MAVEPGEYDEVLNLKIAWTQTIYQLHCRCVAGFPAVAQEPRSAAAAAAVPACFLQDICYTAPSVMLGHVFHRFEVNAIFGDR